MARKTKRKGEGIVNLLEKIMGQGGNTRVLAGI